MHRSHSRARRMPCILNFTIMGRFIQSSYSRAAEKKSKFEQFLNIWLLCRANHQKTPPALEGSGKNRLFSWWDHVNVNGATILKRGSGVALGSCAALLLHLCPFEHFPDGPRLTVSCADHLHRGFELAVSVLEFAPHAHGFMMKGALVRMMCCSDPIKRQAKPGFSASGGHIWARRSGPQ